MNRLRIRRENLNLVKGSFIHYYNKAAAIHSGFIISIYAKYELGDY